MLLTSNFSSSPKFMSDISLIHTARLPQHLEPQLLKTFRTGYITLNWTLTRRCVVIFVCVSFRRTIRTPCSAAVTAQQRKRLSCCLNSQSSSSGTTLLTVQSHPHAARHTLYTQFSQDVWLLDLERSLNFNPSSSSFDITARENKPQLHFSRCCQSVKPRQEKATPQHGHTIKRGSKQ